MVVPAQTEPASVPAVILRTRPLGEADLVVVLLTPSHGKVEAAARNARKSKRRFAGGLSPGMRGHATIARGRRSTSSSLMRLNGFEPTVLHADVGRDLTRFAFVAYVCELTDELVLGQQPDPKLFAEVCTALDLILGPQGQLQPSSSPPSAAALRRFELVLLRELGLLPALRQCAVCGRTARTPAATEVAFDARLGGVLCAEHGARATRLDAMVLAVAATLCVDEVGASQAEAALVEIDQRPAGFRRGLRDVTYGVLRQHLRRPLRSLALFRQLAIGSPRTTGD